MTHFFMFFNEIRGSRGKNGYLFRLDSVDRLFFGGVVVKSEGEFLYFTQIVEVFTENRIRLIRIFCKLAK